MMELQSAVWLGKWKQAQAGTLSFSDGRLSLECGEKCLFDAPQAMFTQIKWHWYSLGGAVEMSINGESYFLSFVPRMANLSSWHAGLTEGHKWQAALSGKAVSKRGPIWPKVFISLYSLIQAFFYGIAGILILAQTSDASHAMWVRIGGGLMVCLLLFMIGYLLWRAVSIPFRSEE
jgi:hypothetical protein